MTYSIIQKSQLENKSFRIDPEYYQPKYLEIEDKLNRLSHKSLEEISDSIVSFGAYALTSFIEWQKEGVPFIVAENVKEGIIDLENVRYISEEVDEILKKSRVKEGQVLLSMSGSVGSAAVAHNIPQKLNSNQDIVKITLKEDTLSPYFLAAFLNSDYGRKQVLRLPVGSVQQHIFLWQTKGLLIPEPPKKTEQEIEKIYLKVFKNLSSSKNWYFQAEKLLLEELGLSDFEIPQDLAWIVDYSEVEEDARVDAEHFHPKYEKLVEAVKTYGYKRLVEVAEDVPARFKPKSDPEKTFKYVELSNIDLSIGIIEGNSEVLGKEAPSRAKRLLKNSDVVVSSVEGSLSKVAIVGEEQEGGLASTGFFQFRAKRILPEVLLVLAKSIILQLQLEKETTGTILSAVPSTSVERLIIPDIPKPTQQKIADLVKKSHEARKKSKDFLEEAKRKVEEMIDSASSLQVEKGGYNEKHD